MSTATEHLEHGHDEHDEKHFTDGQYVIVALILALLTAIEVSLAATIQGVTSGDAPAIAGEASAAHRQEVAAAKVVAERWWPGI